MTTIKAKPITANCTPQQAFEYVTDLNNFEHLLPTEKLSDFKSSKDEVSFKAQGSFYVGLRVSSSNEFDKVVFSTTEDSAIKFDLNVLLTDNGDGTTGIEQVCEAKLNPFLKMMIEKPLTNLFDYISKQMVAVHS